MALMGCVLSPVWAYTQASQPASWGGLQRNSGAAAPSYQFRSTSPLLDNTSGSSGGYSSRAGSPVYSPRRGDPWSEEGDPTDPGTGIVPDPAPVGGPYVLLAMAAAYFLLSRRRKTT